MQELFFEARKEQRNYFLIRVCKIIRKSILGPVWIPIQLLKLLKALCIKNHECLVKNTQNTLCWCLCIYIHAPMQFLSYFLAVKIFVLYTFVCASNFTISKKYCCNTKFPNWFWSIHHVFSLNKDKGRRKPFLTSGLFLNKLFQQWETKFGLSLTKELARTICCHNYKSSRLFFLEGKGN